MKAASNCRDMTDVRTEIDLIDKELVKLIAQRSAYIAAAARIKQDRAQIRDEFRIADVLNKVSAAAQAEGAPPAIVAAAFRAIIEASIAYELSLFETRKA